MKINSTLTFHHESVHLDEVGIVLLQVDRILFHFVERWPEEDSQRSLQLLVGFDVYVVGERLIVETGTTRLQTKIQSTLEVLHRHRVVDQSVAGVEECVQLVDVHGLEFYAWQLQLALRILRLELLVSVLLNITIIE